ncbi:hypothetical protein [Streptomyces sp. enrichment culture]|uniref:hypothetical protein n=1 Tax=Streptomyces sp. enrichment culture TaxID=1795815 RepID=UPI003F57AB06
MNNPQRTDTDGPRAALAILGARRARARSQFVAIVARQLDLIAPGTVRVTVAPVTVAGRRRTWVELIDAAGRAVPADRAAARDARGLLSRAFPDADWTQPRVYDARTGALAVDLLAAPDELHLDTPEVNA